MVSKVINRVLKELDFIETQKSKCEDIPTRVHLERKAKELKIILKEFLENNTEQYKGKIVKDKGLITRSFDE